MKTVVVTKMLDENHIECREYYLFKDVVKLIHCVAPDYKSCSHENEEYMILTLSQQKKGKVVNTLQSKFPPYSYYRMYKFLWKPTKKEENLDVAPTSLGNILWGLSEAQRYQLRVKLGIDNKKKMI